jgi:hypothetical protein
MPPWPTREVTDGIRTGKEIDDVWGGHGDAPASSFVIFSICIFPSLEFSTNDLHQSRKWEIPFGVSGKS